MKIIGMIGTIGTIRTIRSIKKIRMMNRMKQLSLTLASLFIVLAGLSFQAFAETEPPVFKMTLKDHKFDPSVIKVPAGTKFKIEVKNEDQTSEEFESAVLNVEKIVGPKKTLRLVLGPLKAGNYSFVGEFNKSTALGEFHAE